MNKKKILIVDDEAGITRGVKLNLEALGDYEVRQENHARSAIRSAKEFHPDLILLDVMMPEMDGGEIASQLQDEPSLRKTPVVFLTAIVSRKETHGGEVCIGNHEFLAKPVDLDTLTEVIAKHLPD